MFEKATRLKLRFSTAKGLLSIEDLWDLPLTSRSGGVNLDDIARVANKEVEDSARQSFVHKATKENEAARLKFDIVKHIIDVRLAERDAASRAAEETAKKKRIMELIAHKQDQALEGKTIEELQQLL